MPLMVTSLPWSATVKPQPATIATKSQSHRCMSCPLPVCREAPVLPTKSKTATTVACGGACANVSVLSFRLRNVLLLTLTQATSSTSVTLIAAVGSLAGYALASNKALSTLPSTMSVIGTALSTIPASLLMKRVGRRAGFVLGALCAAAGGLISVAALAGGRFWLLTAGALLLGVSVAFAQQYRFAAAEPSLP